MMWKNSVEPGRLHIAI